MHYFLIITYIISLGVLLKLPDHNHSSKRFWIKLLTCIHPLLILLVGLMRQSIETIDAQLLFALIFALLGDISLGLKHHHKSAMPIGIFFFSLTHIALSVMLYEKSGFIWTLFIVFVAWLSLFKLLMQQLNFGSHTKMIAIYAFLILGMFGLASNSLFQNRDLFHFIQWLGALSFLLSDTLLSQKYFSKSKPTWINATYLILYHLALSLFVFSAFA